MVTAPQISDFIALVAPGFVAVEVFRSAYPAKTRSDKSNLYLYVVYSLICATILSLLSHHSSISSFSLQVPAKGSSFYPFLLLAVGWLVGQACIFCYWIRHLIPRKCDSLRWLRPDPQSTWNRINDDLDDQWVYVFLKDGSIYVGQIRFWNFDPDSPNQDFFLDRARRVDERLDPRGQKSAKWKERYLVETGVYISTAEVSRIEFQGSYV
ncbi:MAG: hypothetical protein RLZZ54_717 [Cyanobacteriota bacterium]|jgi:hypothetical protein